MKGIAYWRERLAFSLRHRGLRGTFARALFCARQWLTPRAWRNARFDSTHGVDTSGRIAQYELGGGQPAAAYAVEYRPSPVTEFLRILKDLDIDYEQWTFLDLGAGKGRAVLLASHFRFRRIVGVEFDPGLSRIAEANVAVYTNHARRCNDIRIVCGDAASYPLPADCTVIYMNNPFQGAVMERVVNNIDASLAANPRDLIVVYWNPFCSELLGRAHSLQRTVHKAQYAIYTSAQFRAYRHV